jgi:hemolysin III
VQLALVPPKPRLRGWLHLGTLPFALGVGLFLTANGRTHPDRVAVAVFTATACLLFGTSAVYHRGTWTPKTIALLRRLDLSNIALIIAGTYTPIAVAVLSPGECRVLLWIVWVAASIIVVFSVGWRSSRITAPRWFYTGTFIVLGWAAVAWFPELWQRGGVVNFCLIVLGGVLYTCGGAIYALKRPALSPTTFGYHELFHACTVAAFTCHVLVVARVAG